MLEPIAITITDKNIKYINSTNEEKNNNDGKQMFLTNIKYIFDDDDPLLINDDTNIGFENANNDNIENILMINMKSLTEINNIELISDKFKLLDYNLWSQNGKITDFNDLDLEIDVLSLFQDWKNEGNEFTLNELIDLYKIQNTQLKLMMNNL